ncbi:hypothetical protein [Flavobacterium sp. LC2016-01]|uniref:hypothetical protein n=1 Tax=Flavobacterium sp. LC2016-01 TaxID=2675876 RepID=UPI0012BAEAF4|nr:hypothetical protein [Flavobacterium sp. LC2016-01]MTH14131.1 hypothetical protein [Flavobacterium sp. LC2016-01]
MKKALFFLLLIFSIVSCKNEKTDFKLYSCEYNVGQYTDSIYYSKWIDSKDDAFKTKLTFDDSKLNQRNLDSLYKKTAQFLFVIGGGSLSILPKDCVPEIKNDTLFIRYKAISHSGVGEIASSNICLEINKKKYPNFKNMKIAFVKWDGLF